LGAKSLGVVGELVGRGERRLDGGGWGAVAATVRQVSVAWGTWRRRKRVVSGSKGVCWRGTGGLQIARGRLVGARVWRLGQAVGGVPPEREEAYPE
jgi:hypothetical protein